MLMFGAGFILFSQTDSVLDYYLTFALMAAGSSIAGFLTVATTVVNCLRGDAVWRWVSP